MMRETNKSNKKKQKTKNLSHNGQEQKILWKKKACKAGRRDPGGNRIMRKSKAMT